MANVIDFVLAQSEQLPLTRRAVLYRDLAQICGDEQEAANLRELSLQLARADALCREFNFSFSQKLNSETQSFPVKNSKRS